MKHTHKLFMLGLTLLGVVVVNSKNVLHGVKAEEESGSYVTFKEGTLEIGDIDKTRIAKLTITNKPDKLDGTPVEGSPFAIEYDTTNSSEGCYLEAYLYNYNAEDNYNYDCVIYSNADKIYANNSVGDLIGYLGGGDNAIVSGMFTGFNQLTELDLSELDTSKVTNMFGMFSNCYSLTTLDLSNFDTSNVTEMGLMFSFCTNLSELNVSSFDTSKVEDISGMFAFCCNLTELDLSNFNTSNVIYMWSVFANCSGLTELSVSSFDTSKVVIMIDMFSGCEKLTEIDVSKFNTSNVIAMDGMFHNCSSLTSLNVSSFDTSNVTSMSNMFNSCEKLTELDLSNFDTSQVTDMGYMFSYCEKLTTLDLSNFDTSNVESMWGMFENCSGLTTLDLSSFDMSNVTESYYMLSGTDNLQQIKTPEKLGDNVIDLSGNLMNLSTMTNVDAIDGSMADMILFAESDDLNVLINFINDINSLNMCEDYNQADELRTRYDNLNPTYQEAFNSTKNEDGTLLIEKLEYMERYKEIKSNEKDTGGLGNQMLRTLISDDYNVITIIALTLTSFIGIAGYYFIQKRKNIKA